MAKFDWIKKYGDSFMNYPMKDLTFRKDVWIHGDHDHCLFCGKEITANTYDYETDKQAYHATTGCWWACAKCFEEFSMHYDIPIIKNTIAMIEEALLKGKDVIISLKNDQYMIKFEEDITVEHDDEKESYENFSTMLKNCKFYGRMLNDVIDDVYLGFI